MADTGRSPLKKQRWSGEGVRVNGATPAHLAGLLPVAGVGPWMWDTRRSSCPTPLTSNTHHFVPHTPPAPPPPPPPMSSVAVFGPVVTGDLLAASSDRRGAAAMMIPPPPPPPPPPLPMAGALWDDAAMSLFPTAMTTSAGGEGGDGGGEGGDRSHPVFLRDGVALEETTDVGKQDVVDFTTGHQQQHQQLQHQHQQQQHQHQPLPQHPQHQQYAKLAAQLHLRMHPQLRDSGQTLSSFSPMSPQSPSGSPMSPVIGSPSVAPLSPRRAPMSPRRLSASGGSRGNRPPPAPTPPPPSTVWGLEPSAWIPDAPLRPTPPVLRFGPPRGTRRQREVEESPVLRVKDGDPMVHGDDESSSSSRGATGSGSGGHGSGSSGGGGGGSGSSGHEDSIPWPNGFPHAQQAQANPWSHLSAFGPHNQPAPITEPHAGTMSLQEPAVFPSTSGSIAPPFHVAAAHVPVKREGQPPQPGPQEGEAKGSCGTPLPRARGPLPALRVDDAVTAQASAQVKSLVQDVTHLRTRVYALHARACRDDCDRVSAHEETEALLTEIRAMFCRCRILVTEVLLCELDVVTLCVAQSHLVLLGHRVELVRAGLLLWSPQGRATVASLATRTQPLGLDTSQARAPARLVWSEQPLPQSYKNKNRARAANTKKKGHATMKAQLLCAPGVRFEASSSVEATFLLDTAFNAVVCPRARAKGMKGMGGKARKRSNSTSSSSSPSPSQLMLALPLPSHSSSASAPHSRGSPSGSPFLSRPLSSPMRRRGSASSRRGRSGSTSVGATTPVPVGLASSSCAHPAPVVCVEARARQDFNDALYRGWAIPTSYGSRGPPSALTTSSSAPTTPLTSPRSPRTSTPPVPSPSSSPSKGDGDVCFALQNASAPLLSDGSVSLEIRFPAGTRCKPARLCLRVSGLLWLPGQESGVPCCLTSAPSNAFIITTNEYQWESSEGKLARWQTYGAVGSCCATWPAVVNGLRLPFLRATQQEPLVHQRARERLGLAGDGRSSSGSSSGRKQEGGGETWCAPRPLSARDVTYLRRTFHRLTGTLVGSHGCGVPEPAWNQLWSWFGKTLHLYRHNASLRSLLLGGVLWGFIGRNDVESLLAPEREGAFVVRNSEGSPGELTVAFRGTSGHVAHYKIPSRKITPPHHCMADYVRSKGALRYVVQPFFMDLAAAALDTEPPSREGSPDASSTRKAAKKKGSGVKKGGKKSGTAQAPPLRKSTGIATNKPGKRVMRAAAIGPSVLCEGPFTLAKHVAFGPWFMSDDDTDMQGPDADGYECLDVLDMQ